MDMKELWNRYNLYIAGGMMLIIIIIIAVLIFPGKGAVEIVEETSLDNIQEESEEAEGKPESSSIFVEVKGAVKHPGVYEMAADARVKNVLEIAQLEHAADLISVNQSMKLSDEMVIYIPTKEESEDFNPSEGYDPPAEEGADNTTVNINTGEIAELTTLNGIGEKKAQLIVDYREENGLFMKPEDLMNIPGIGEKTFESLEPYITID
ncbi:helix-hairpin-helix domain-containing protein [Salinicoccus albus]|uniref:helix-hairpin-helix domain-containing protein n=1 Tax=Salinicoccus albus TaxID=418756 RepID=UPI0003811DAE|nr:helix-hairpin-helix domain-containing protein [Salinicoccus albus]